MYRVDSLIKKLFYGALAGIAGGVIGGGLFGAIVGLIEQFDSKYDDPTFFGVLMAMAGYFLFGVFFGVPFGLLCGLIFGFVPSRLYLLQQVPKIGTFFGVIVGACISFGLLNGPIEVWAGVVLFLLSVLGGAVGGRVGGLVYCRLLTRSCTKAT